MLIGSIIPQMRTGTCLALILILLTCGAGPSTAPATQPHTGRFTTSFPFPPASDYKKLVGRVARRYGLPIPGGSFHELRAIVLTPDGRTHPPKPDADTLKLDPLSNAYDVYVPADYTPNEKPYGLIAWISPGERGGPREAWVESLDKRQIIFVAPRDVPNPSHSVWRAFMALESVRFANNTFTIDPDRVYVAGMSGGGRISSHVAMFFPETFGGCFAICGCNFYRDVPVPGQKDHVWPGFWPSPEAPVVRKARADGRFVLLTGTKDFNLEPTKGAHNAMLGEKFAHATLLEVPGLAHELPDAEWFDKGLAALDAPVFDGAEDRYKQAIESEKKRKLGEAMLAFESAARHGGDKSFVKDASERGSKLRAKYDAQLALVQQLIESKQADKASLAVRDFKATFAPASSDRADELLELIKALRALKPTATKPAR
jgi:hypothetical protein